MTTGRSSATKDLPLLLLVVIGLGGWWSYEHLGMATTIGIAVALVAAALAVTLGVASRHGKAHTRHGMSRAQVSREMGSLNLRTRAPHTRPSVHAGRAPLAELGILIGRDVQSRAQIWSSLEDSLLVVGPPRSGKTAGVVVPTVAAYPGPVVSTSTRPEVARLTAEARTGRGPCVVFAPQAPDSSPAPGVEPLRWSPSSGCDDPMRAIVRAGALVAAGAGLGASVTNADYWAASATAVMRCYLHAAALDTRPIGDVLTWAREPSSRVPVNILRRDPAAAAGWADELVQAAAEPRLAANVWSGVRRALDCLADPRVAEACSPLPDHGFDPDEFVASPGALYVWGEPSAQLSVAPLIAALVASVADAGRRRAASAPHGRLDPPLGLVLDEAANIAPLPDLPVLLSDGGGNGITTLVVLQSLAQARHRWGEARASAIWDAATTKLILPGLAHPDDLAALSRLAGEVEIASESTTAGPQGTSATTGTTWRPRWSPDAIRGLASGHGLVLHRRVAPVEVELIPHWKR